MESSSQPEPPPKLLGSPRLKLRLAAGSLAILGAGALVAPKAPTPLPASQERPVPLLEQELQRREPARIFRPIQDIARRVLTHNVTIPPIARAAARTVPDNAVPPTRSSAPAGFGVVVDAQGSVLTHASALAGRASVQVQTSAGQSLPAELAAYEASTGLALLRVSGGTALPAAPMTAVRPEPGSLAATAARWEGRDIVAPVFVTSAGPETYAIDAHGAALGGIALYSLDGEAFAIVGSAGQGTAYPIREAAARLIAQAASGHRLDASIGVMFQPVAGALLKVFDARGALVSDTLPGGPADTAGLAPGDVLTSVAGTAVESPAAAQKLVASLQPGVPVPIDAVRDGRTLTLTVTPGSPFELARRTGTLAAASPPGVPAGAFLPRESLQAAGVATDAIVLSVNGHTVLSPADARREWERSRGPALLYVEEARERFFSAAEPAR